VHAFEQRQESRIDRDGSNRIPCFREGLRLAVPCRDRFADVHGARVEVDVVPGDRLELLGPDVGVGGDGVHLAPKARHVLAGEQLRKLVGVDERLLALGRLEGRLVPMRWVIGAHPELFVARGHGLFERRAEHAPNVLRRGAADADAKTILDPETHLLVEGVTDSLDLIAADIGDRAGTDARRQPLAPDRPLLSNVAHALPFAHLGQPSEISVAGFRREWVVELGLLRLPLALRGEQLPGLVLPFLNGLRVQLRALLGGHATRPTGDNFRWDVNAFARSVAQPDACSKVDRTVGAATGFNVASSGGGHRDLGGGASHSTPSPSARPVAPSARPSKYPSARLGGGRHLDQCTDAVPRGCDVSDQRETRAMRQPQLSSPSTQLISLLDYAVDRLSERILARLDEQVEREPLPALIDRATLARQLGVSIPTVDRLRRQGCPTVWVCDAPRFELPRVLDFLRTMGPRS